MEPAVIPDEGYMALTGMGMRLTAGGGNWVAIFGIRHPYLGSLD